MKWIGKHPVFSDLLIGGVLLTPPDPQYEYELTLPNDDGTAGQVLTTDGNGVLTWVTNSAGGTGVSMTNGVNNRIMTATAAQDITGEADLTYDASSEILTVGAIQMRGPGGNASFSYNGETYASYLEMPSSEGISDASTGGIIKVADGSGSVEAANLTIEGGDAAGTNMRGGIMKFVLGAHTGSGTPGSFQFKGSGVTEIAKIYDTGIRLPIADQAIVFEGGSHDTTFKAVTSAGAARTITLPDATGTVALTSDIVANTNLATTNLTLPSGPTSRTFELDSGSLDFQEGTNSVLKIDGSAPTVTIPELSITDLLTISNGASAPELKLKEPSGGGSSSGILTVGALGGDRTYTFPDATGTVALTSDITNTTLNGTTAGGVATYASANTLDIESTLFYTAHNLTIGDNGSSTNYIKTPDKAASQPGTMFALQNGSTSGTNMAAGAMTFNSGMSTGEHAAGAYVFAGGPAANPAGGSDPSPARDLFTLATKGGVATNSYHILHDLNSTRDYFKTTITTAAAVYIENIHGSGAGTPSITLDSTGDLYLTSTTNIEINADGGNIDFKDSSAQLAKISTTGLDFTDNTSAGIIFEGATDNAHKTTLNVVDPTGTRAVNLPDASGTVALQEKQIIIKNMGFYNTSTAAFYLPMLEYISESTYVTSYVSSFVPPYDGRVIKVGPGWSNNGTSRTSTYKFYKNKQSTTQTGTTHTTASFTTTIPEVTPTDWTFSKGEPIHIQVTNSASISSVSMTVTIELDTTT